jgi:hypothetical protein
MGSGDSGWFKLFSSALNGSPVDWMEKVSGEQYRP